nr:MAG TPA: hypothetical protein [Caudoviricetes sp.]
MYLYLKNDTYYETQKKEKLFIKKIIAYQQGESQIAKIK